jgi:DNA repair photolyase
MAIKKTYLFLSKLSLEPLARGVKRRIRLMKNDEHIGIKKQEKRESLLEQVIKEGARKLLQAAIENEVAEYIAVFSEIKDENGRRMVVKN